ncbi:MAG: hypothetical protein ABR505_01650 [Actinomycetota bacterium]
MSAFLRVILSLTVAIATVACGGDNTSGEAGAAGQNDRQAQPENTLTITERDYEFAVEGEIEAGTVSIAVTNEGAEFHEIAMARLLQGKTLEDVRSALESSNGQGNVLDGVVEDDAVIDDLGGVQLPGTSYTITGSGIGSGDYVLLCFIPNPQGRPHFSLGMTNGFTVAEGDASDDIDTDVTYTATNDDLEGPDTLDAGQATIEVVNNSDVDREISLLKITEGKTLEDVGAWFESGRRGPPEVAESPLDFLAFIFDARQDRKLTVELTPGQWAISSSDPEKPFEGPPAEDPDAVLITVE